MSDSDKFGLFLGRQNMDNCLTENDVLLLLMIMNYHELYKEQS